MTDNTKETLKGIIGLFIILFLLVVVYHIRHQDESIVTYSVKEPDQCSSDC
jgi:hypothetical protein